MQAVIAISFVAFIFNTSEFIPIGLLTLIATDFRITEAKAGFLMSVYALVVAFASLPLMLMCSRFNLRKLLLFVMGLFVVVHLFLAFANSYAMLIFLRIGVACAHALFWSIATPMAVRAAPKGKESIAISFVIVGTSTALLAGVPLGRMIGLYFGWRVSFFIIGIVAFLVFLALLKTLPQMPSGGVVSLRSLPQLLKTPKLLGVYGITMCLVTAHFIAYSYIEPFLAQNAHFSQNGITATLVIFGAMGVVGGYLFSKYYDKHKETFLAFAIFGVFVALLLLKILSFNSLSIVLVCVLWGLSITLFGLTLQAKVLYLVPVGTSIAMSIFSGIYNLGIGSGAYFGGLIVGFLNAGYVGYFGALIAFCVCVYYRLSFAKEIPKAES
ncbi:sugar transporter [Helicobacter sp.]|uniref:sugar transporter n=1 Tax=Helicobacter sp. TaxID=218 RepID=UPI0025BB54AD|nr:sugar transporter [Helicobacter sp.]MCI5968525.1 sugar transporter [Helicobacter sp.]MDY2584734.1 sugar transporter [Helicobacter sp.]